MAQKEKRISINALEEAAKENCNNIITVQWNGIDVNIRKMCLYIKLGQKITDRIPAKLRPLTAEDPEYWGLAGLVTDEMADVALKMKVRKPMTLPQLVKTSSA